MPHARTVTKFKPADCGRLSVHEWSGWKQTSSLFSEEKKKQKTPHICMHRCTYKAAKSRVELPTRRSGSSLSLQTHPIQSGVQSEAPPPLHTQTQAHKQSHPPAPSAPTRSLGRESPSTNTPCAFAQPSSFLSRFGHSCGAEGASERRNQKSRRRHSFAVSATENIRREAQLQFPPILRRENEMRSPKQSKRSKRLNHGAPFVP